MLNNIRFILALSFIVSLGVFVAYVMFSVVISLFSIMIPVTLVVLISWAVYKIYKKIKK